MREPPNRLLRVVLPLVLVLAGVGVLFAVLQNTKTANRGTAGTLTRADGAKPAAGAADAAGDQPGPEAPSAAVDQTTPTVSTPPTSTTPPPATADSVDPAAAERPSTAVAKYTVKKHAMPAAGYRPVGSTVAKKDGGTYELELRFAPFGVGLERLTLANHTEKILAADLEVLQQFHPVVGAADPRLGLAAFSAKGVRINGVEVGLGVDPSDPTSTLWEERAPGDFAATIVDGDGRDVARITRRFVLAPGSYEFTLEQRVENLTDRPMEIVWHQIGPVDQPPETVRYGGDPRNVRFGYMASSTTDPAQIVQAGDGAASLLHHADALGSPDVYGNYPARTLWPNRTSQADQLTLAWAATTSRYFTVAVHPAPPPPHVDAAGKPTATTPAQRALDFASIERVAVPTSKPATAAPSARGPFGAVGLELVSPKLTVAPGQAADLTVAAYAGPTSKKYIQSEPQAARVGLSTILVYTFGGPCAFCTFQSITYLLRWFLGILHDYVVFDWAIAVMLLVVFVRSCLHPVTRWSQVNMMRFSKSLAKLAPKQKAIQEKYGNDPMKMREESARLMREEGISVGAGAMGCLPAFLQMPVWLALAPMLYFTFELRHQGAFYGLFQAVSGGKWSFFADLAEPDHFLRFGREFHIPLISGLMGPIDGLNIMPLLMGVVFYIQQKYMQPPQTTPMTPEQEQQMKIMKVMMVIMFPVMMYNAPSGLALYFFTNSTLAILENKHIRKKAEPKIDAEIAAKDAKRAAGYGKAKDANRKPGFLERMSKLAEERQKMMDEARKLQAKKGKRK